MTKGGPYSRVYLSIIDDPMFEKVFNDNDALATWLRMLLLADAMYPVSAPMPRKNRALLALIEASLVIELPGNRYSMRGLDAERERRSHAGRNAAAVRWQSERNADPMPRRDETSKDETSNGQLPKSFIAFRPKGEPDRAPGEAVVPRHEGQHLDCLVCGTAKPSDVVFPDVVKEARRRLP